MGPDINKQFMGLAGKPVLAHSLLTFERADFIDGIIVVVKSEDISRCREEIIEAYAISKSMAVVAGGDRRQDSVHCGLMELPAQTAAVCIHDGARPLVDEDCIKNTFDALSEYDGAVLGIPVNDTIKRANDDGTIRQTEDRSGLWLIQTPQTFKPAVIMKAYQQARIDGFEGTDDAMLIERINGSVKIEMGSPTNIKVTRPEDIKLAEAFLSIK